MQLKPGTLGRLAAIQQLFAQHENHGGESLSNLFKECFSHDTRVDTALRNKITNGVTEQSEKLDAIFAQYGKEDSPTLFKCFFKSMAFEALWMKKETAILWSEYKQLAEMFFHESQANALKALLNNLAKE
ncbi:MAG: hypothetical protein JXQ74_01630 [Alphaproteobacteria bacterium]|nr:hypothetical protein [Alphaproteobacteria bacterium]